MLVNNLIGRVADKWTMLILEVLAEKEELRFKRLSELVVGISQKMLTQTLRQMQPGILQPDPLVRGQGARRKMRSPTVVKTAFLLL